MPKAADLLGQLDALDSEKEELRRALRDATRRLHSKEIKHAEYAETLWAAVNAARLAYPPPVKAPTLRTSRTAKPEVALLHLTDWQYGKHTPSYGVDIAAARIRQCFASACKLANIHRADHPVDEIHVMLGGDMVEGLTVFPGQVWEIEADLHGQMFGIANLIVEGVLLLLSQFKRVVVWCEYGNHGRIGRKGDLPATDNIDLFAYEIAHRDLKNQRRLTWHEPIDFYQQVEIGDYRAMLIHGDELYRSSAEKSIKDRAHMWAALLRKHDKFDFTDVYVGHLHRMSEYPLETGGAVFITPSIESDNGFARVLMSAQGYPAQRLHMIRPDLGVITAKHTIWLD